ncbi:MAG: DUF2892 domain-containing protein [Acidiphilium sp.]|jgi:Protein of unknown function (DUF2892).|nr:DUF2892 domain-containing protein [Acidiphilium sp.]
MNIDKSVFALAGFMVLLSVALTLAFSQWWLLLTGFVGLNLLQTGFTGLCPAAMIFKRLGVKPGCAIN